MDERRSGAERRSGTDRRSPFRDAVARLDVVQQNRRLLAFVEAVRLSLQGTDAWDSAVDSEWCEAVGAIELALSRYDEGA